MNGRELKEQGQAVALAHAGPDWGAYIMRKLRAFCQARKRMGCSIFRFEEFREVAEKQGWDLPLSPNAWGAIPIKACRLGLIKWTGKYELAKSQKTHSHPVKLWEAL